MISTVGFTVGTATPALDEIEDVAEAIEASFRTRFGFNAAGSIYAGWSYHGADAYLAYHPADETIIVTRHYGTTVTGTASGETPPVNTAILMQKRSAEGGRENRGRMYLPPARLTEGDISKLGVIESTALASLNSSANNWLSDVEAISTDPDPQTNLVILHSDPDSLPTIITDLEVASVVATQRRRLRR